MSYNGSGTFTLAAGNPVVTGTTISSTWANNTLSDIATGLTTAICKDGQTTPTANIPLGTFKLTGMGVGSALTDSVTLGQAQNAAFQWCGTSGGSANAQTLTPTPAITSYVAGQTFRFKAGFTNAGATTVAISGLGTIAVQSSGTALAGGEIIVNQFYEIILDTTSTAQLLAVAASAGTLPFSDATALVKNSSDATKKIIFSAASITTGTTRTLTSPDASGVMGIESAINGNFRNLKCSITTASATATFTADQVVVGTSLSGVSQRLNSYSQALNLATNGAGGMDTGTAPTSGFVSIYAIAKVDGTTSVLACAVATSTASIYGGGNMPSGYTYSALLGILPTDGSHIFKPGFLIDRRWNYQTAVNILSGVTGNATLASQSISAAVPTVARYADVWLSYNATSKAMYAVAGDGTGSGSGVQVAFFAATTTAAIPGGAVNAGISATFKDIPIITSQTIYWMDAATAGSASRMDIPAYTV